MATFYFFGTNKQTDWNQQTSVRSLQSQKESSVISDYIIYVGGIQYVDVTNKKLMFAAAAACQKYSA